MSIVQVPDTFFENNNIDEIAVSDDLAKMMFPPFEETPDNVAQNSMGSDGKCLMLHIKHFPSLPNQ